MSELAAFIELAFGRPPADLKLFDRAVTHASVGRNSYDRLEFLGDRVLGLVVASWLYERFPDEPEGLMSKRFNSLVSRETCAEVGRAIGVPAHIRLGKQAREDRAANSDNVVGDVVEALIGALFLDSGLDAAQAFIRSAWADYVDNQERVRSTPNPLCRRWRRLEPCSAAYEVVTHRRHHGTDLPRSGVDQKVAQTMLKVEQAGPETKPRPSLA